MVLLGWTNSAFRAAYWMAENPAACCRSLATRSLSRRALSARAMAAKPASCFRARSRLADSSSSLRWSFCRSADLRTSLSLLLVMSIWALRSRSRCLHSSSLTRRTSFSVRMVSLASMASARRVRDILTISAALVAYSSDSLIWCWRVVFSSRVTARKRPPSWQRCWRYWISCIWRTSNSLASASVRWPKAFPPPLSVEAFELWPSFAPDWARPMSEEAVGPISSRPSSFFSSSLSFASSSPSSSSSSSSVRAGMVKPKAPSRASPKPKGKAKGMSARARLSKKMKF
mmetsp:Transcript_31263/g.91560  ORF Transcript_31263/g.91560 Transcript_31263/m.91560 type:complete len:287 (-) Transcript_31263:66-926(-)